jgi:hypothetical protein
MSPGSASADSRTCAGSRCAGPAETPREANVDSEPSVVASSDLNSVAPSSRRHDRGVSFFDTERGERTAPAVLLPTNVLHFPMLLIGDFPLTRKKKVDTRGTLLELDGRGFCTPPSKRNDGVGPTLGRKGVPLRGIETTFLFV